MSGGETVGARFVIRFKFPEGQRYAAHHPDPPHDYALSERLADALTWATYADARRVLDWHYGARDRLRAGRPIAQGHWGEVAILGEILLGIDRPAALGVHLDDDGAVQVAG